MHPKGRNLILATSVIIIIFAGLALLMSFASFAFIGSGGAEMLEQINAEEIITAAGISMDDILSTFGILGNAFALVGIYLLLLGVLGILFSKNPKRAPILIALGAIALIFQSLAVFLLLFSSPPIALLFGGGLIVYALFLTGAIGNMRPSFSEPTIIGESNESLMDEVKMGDGNING